MNKVALMETKIEELEKKERNSREKQETAAKVTTQLEQEVRSMREVLRRSFKVAPKDPGFPKSRKATRNRQKKLEEDLASLVEQCATNAGNLAKVKLEQDDLSSQLEGLLIMEEEPRERLAPTKWIRTTATAWTIVEDGRTQVTKNPNRRKR